MPIRFRCAYCNQLMGIAHRKAGTVVRCPKCAGELIVPTPPDMPSADGSSPGNGSDPEINISEILDNAELGRELSVPPQIAEPEPTAATTAAVAAPETVVTADDPPVIQPGVVLSRPVVMLLVGLAVLVVGTAFVAGFLVGRWTAAV